MTGIVAVSGFARSFLTPARQALGADLVPRELYANSVTWRSGAWQLAAVGGPAIGGILYAIGGTTLAYSRVDVEYVDPLACASGGSCAKEIADGGIERNHHDFRADNTRQGAVNAEIEHRFLIEARAQGQPSADP